MTTKTLKRVILASLVTAMAGTTAQAQIVGGSSDSSKVNAGVSTVNGGPHVAGRAGIGIPATGLTTRVDFQGLEAYSPAGLDGVRVLNMPSSAPTDHSTYGAFRFARVGAQDVYFGEWSQTGSATEGDHTVYYAGNSAGTTVPTSGTATYAVTGIGDHATKGALTGTFNATFASGSSGTLTGSLTNAATGAGVNIGTAAITGANFLGNGGTATQSGATIASNGRVEGRFFGANAAALAGLVRFAGARQLDTAFGGTKN